MVISNIIQMKKDFKKAVGLAADKGYYADINYMSDEDLTLSLDKTNSSVDRENDKGVKIRLWDGDKFLEFGSSRADFEIIENEMKKLIEQADKNSKNNSNSIKLNIDTKTANENYGTDKEFEQFKLEDLTNELTNIKNKILGLSENVVNSRVYLSIKNEEHIFVNQYKSLYQRIPINVFVMVGYVKTKDGGMKNAYESFVDSTAKNAINKALIKFDGFAEKLEKVRMSKRLKGGKYKAILSPKLTGLLAHESFGHGMEADTMMKGRALASEWVGKKIGNDNINIVDYANIEGKHGHFYFDHDGNIASKTYLVKNGIINEPISDIYSKSVSNLVHSHNSRFESFDHKNYTRMSNTYFEPGTDELDKMIADIDDGIFVIDSSGGMEDPKGWGVQIQGNFGQRIKNGKLVDEYYDGFALTGFLPDIISKISGVSKEFEIEGGGHCGKGHKEWVRVSEGGPYLKADEVILG